MHRSKRRVLGLVAVIGLLVPAGIMVATADETTPATDFSATPGLPCGPGDLPEATQGRAPTADYTSGRVAQGYTCNASQVSKVGKSGGYRVYRYTDKAGRVCAFYDTTLLFPGNVPSATGDTGVWVLDMTDPANPVHTATLSTPAMQSPHESFSLNVKRGLLGAVFSNPAFYPGQFDIFDASEDCRTPTFKASLPVGVLGHEGSFSPDGLTYYSASLFGHTIGAIDVSDTTLPKLVWTSLSWNIHGMNASDDGRTLFLADNGSTSTFSSGTDGSKGLTILDVSQIQDRVLNPQVHVLGHLTWPRVSTPQTALPVTIKGHPYLVEVDEFGGGNAVGAARIIDIADLTKPKVVSNMRLAVNNPDQQAGESKNDPGASSTLQGYDGHYCGVPSRVEPGIVACSFIASGLRVFDVRDPFKPVEIAYFNKPPPAPTTTGGGAYAMSQPAFDVARGQVWYSDGNTGFYAVQIRPGIWPFPPAPAEGETALQQ